MKTGLLILLFLIVVFVVWETVRITRKGQEAVVAGKKVIPMSWVSDRESGKILIVGDSTSYGTGASGPEHTMAGLLAHDFPQYSINNHSKNALKINEVTPRFLSVAQRGFDYLFVHIGGMDTIHFTPLSTIKRQLHLLCNAAAQHNVKKVFLVSMNNVGSAPLFRFPLSQLYTYRSRQITQACAEVCAEHDIAIHVPLFAEQQDEPLYQNNTSHFSSDQIHPDDEGYKLWYQQIKQKAAPYLS